MQGDNWPSSTWRHLRATRWAPPGAAAHDNQRRRTYVPALNQAEEMFRAAAGAGPSTRPLLLFYGLSQAGRAIAAASEDRTGHGWQLQGHGIHTENRTMTGPLAEIQVRSDPAGSKGSFVRLSEILNSPLLPATPPTTLSVLWDLLPENSRWPIGEDDESRRTPLQTDRFALPAVSTTHAGFPLFDFPPWVQPSSNGPRSLTTYLGSFPSIQGYRPLHVRPQTDTVVAFSRHADGWGEVQINWDLPHGQTSSPAEWKDWLEARTRPYCGEPYFFPALGTADSGMHPLTAWWAVLHTLSMLARYQPAEWVSCMDVNTNRNAVPLERILELSIDIVPRVIAETIDEVANPTH